MSLREVGLLVYRQGLAISREEYIVRELAFCDWTGHHHVLFKYTLPLGLTHYSKTSRPEWIVRPRRCMVYLLNRFCRIITDMNFILTIS